MSDDYKVGYGKPPKKHRFKKERSGNVHGRSRGTKNFVTDLREELNEMITIREGDKTKRMSKQRVFIKSLVADGMKGKSRSTAPLMSLMLRLLGLDDSTPPEQLTREEKEIIERLFKDSPSTVSDNADDSNRDGGVPGGK